MTLEEQILVFLLDRMEGRESDDRYLYEEFPQYVGTKELSNAVRALEFLGLIDSESQMIKELTTHGVSFARNLRRDG